MADTRISGARLSRFLGYEEGRELYSYNCPEGLLAKYESRLIQENVEGRELYAIIPCHAGSSSSGSSGSSGPAPVYYNARLLEVNVEGRELYALENPCCPSVSVSSASSQSQSSSSKSSSSSSSSSGSSSSKSGSSSSGSSSSKSSSSSSGSSSGSSSSSGSASVNGSSSGSVSVSKSQSLSQSGSIDRRSDDRSSQSVSKIVTSCCPAASRRLNVVGSTGVSTTQCACIVGLVIPVDYNDVLGYWLGQITCDDGAGCSNTYIAKVFCSGGRWTLSIDANSSGCTNCTAAGGVELSKQALFGICLPVTGLVMTPWLGCTALQCDLVWSIIDPTP